jgi:pimeloyl-ACP methyl ester carboxylesterase
MPEVATEMVESTSEPTQEPTHESTPEPIPTEPDEFESGQITREVLIPAEGLDLAGTFFEPPDQIPPWRGVVLIHMLYGNQSQWEPFPQLLADEGFAVLSIDLRGHGESGGEVNWDLAVDDMQQVWNYFTSRGDIDQDKTAFVGASIGANLAWVATSNEPAVKTAVLLSPGLNYAGVETEEAMISYGDRPVLIVASQEDTYAANSSTALDEYALGESQLIMYQGAGHGTFMLQAEPDLAQKIADWLSRDLE